MMKRMPLIILILVCLITTNDVFAQEKLIFSVDLIRHGDRTPIQEIPKSPYAWKEGLGQLTAKGMRQEYELGVHFRNKYIVKHQLLPPYYQPDKIYVRSTDVDRTLMSAASVLMGLYPEHPEFNAYQPIPIHTVAKDEDKLLMVRENIMSLLIYNVFGQKDLKRLNQEYKEKLKSWSQNTGLEIKKINQLVGLGDNLYIRRLNGIPFPEKLNSNEVEEIISLSNKVTLTKFRNNKITSPMGNTLLKTVANYFKQVSENKTSLKYVLYSAHDSSIMAVMNTLGSPVNEIPKYSSDLNFSLLKENNQYKVSISLNDKPVIIPGCDAKECTLEKFIQFANI